MFAALGHPLRLDIVNSMAASDDAMSPIAVDRLLGDESPGLPNVAYHVRHLDRAGLVKQKRTKARRGAVEHFFELTALGERAHQLMQKY